MVHFVLFAQLALAVLAAWWLEINAASLALLMGFFVLHEATVWLELRWVVTKREVTPLEQMVHSFMEILPLAGIADGQVH